MLLSLLDSPFLPGTHYGEFAIGPSRNKRGENSTSQPSKCHQFSFCLVLASSSCSAVALQYFCLPCLSPLRVPKVPSCLGQCHQKRLLSKWGDGHGLWPLHTLQCCSSMGLILPQAPWDARHGIPQLHRLAWRNGEKQSVKGKQIRSLTLPTQLP